MTTDVYNLGTFARNDIQDVPKGYAETASNDLFRFLGSFWKNIHEGGKFVKGVQQVRGIQLAQFYLNLLESLKLQDRNGMPVFHRELWKPLVIRRSQANRAEENILRTDDGIAAGAQPAGSKYGAGTVLHMGTLENLDKYVTYPVETDIETIGSGIANNVVNPTVFHKVSTAFPGTGVIYQNGTIIFPKDLDPFAENSGFDVYDIPEMIDDGFGNRIPDAEAVLWASDVLIDKDYVSDHMSYALGIDCPSSDIAKRIVNAGWDALNCGLTPELVRRLLAAMLNIPVVLEDVETVVRIDIGADGSKTVVTNRHAYTVGKHAVLRDSVRIGAELSRGEFLDETVKVYPLMTDPSPEKLAGTTEYADIIERDIPVISIPKSILRTNTANGLSVEWAPADVIDTGETYGGGKYRKLYFDIGGTEEDVQAFWEDVWKHAERDDVDLEELFIACSEDASSSSSGDWRISPIRFFLKYMIGGNTLIVTLDADQAEDASRLRDPMFFDLLNDVLPSGIRLFFIEHVHKDEDGDTYDVSEETEDGAEDFVYEEADEDEFDYSDLPGMRGKRMPTYEDQVEMKMFRNRKRSAS